MMFPAQHVMLGALVLFLLVATLLVSTAGFGVSSPLRHSPPVQVEGTKTARARYEPTWASLDTRPLPEWFDDAKFGIFIHWGLYSVPSFSQVGNYAEWYENYLVSGGNDENSRMVRDFHERTYGSNFKYADFNTMFKAELFNASEWAQLFKKAGARYTVPTSKHHEGFTLWPSPTSWNWNAVDLNPHRNLLKEIMQATRDAGLRAGLYFSLYEWYHPLYLKNQSQYVDQVMTPQWQDLIDNYKPDVLWCDGDWEADSSLWHSKEFLAYIYNDSPVASSIVVNDRLGTDATRKHGDFFTPEYDASVFTNKKWEANIGIDVHSYGLNRLTHADQYLSAQYLLNYLVRTVSNGGNLLLDIGPNADGSIPRIMEQRLLDIGSWLDVNGEAIYGTRKWRVQQEGSIDATSVRYTANKDSSVFYGLIIDWPSNNTLVLHEPIIQADAAISMLGVAGTLYFTPLSDGKGVTVTLPQLNPSHMPCLYIWVLRFVNFK